MALQKISRPQRPQLSQARWDMATARVAQHRLLQRVHLPRAAAVSAGARGPRFAAGKAVKAPRSTQRQRLQNLSSPPRDPLWHVGDRLCLFLIFLGHFGGSRYPVVPRGGWCSMWSPCSSGLGLRWPALETHPRGHLPAGARSR